MYFMEIQIFQIYGDNKLRAKNKNMKVGSHHVVKPGASGRVSILILTLSLTSGIRSFELKTIKSDRRDCSHLKFILFIWNKLPPGFTMSWYYPRQTQFWQFFLLLQVLRCFLGFRTLITLHGQLYSHSQF